MRKISLLFVCLFAINFAKAQENVITTAVPFLLVSADARSAGMADNGVASSADSYSQQWNPAKYAFAIEKTGFSISYTPYLTDLVNDISLGQLNYYNRVNERSAFAGSFRFFGLGDIELRENADDQPRVVSPSEFAFDGSYSLKLSDKFSMAVGARYINSNLKVASDVGDASSASAFAIDVAGFFQTEELPFSDFNGRWRAGFNIQNLGPKLSYDNTEFSSNFLPANLKLGGGFDFILDDYNKVAVNLEISKLLVPTPQDPDLNGDGTITPDERNQNNQDYQSIGWLQGALQSFSDAPGGFSEELKEITYSLGTEYLYQDSFALRAGYFHENKDKGARQFFTLGAGFRYNVVKVDVSYLFSTSKVKNPLENTLRFSLTFNIGDKYDEY
ncbi:MAG TPA: type IX secretion system outer membrane channel protein PorV [Flavobacterium alvei]|nr:type IX secretion system outer membrane channel protein PorV [Flavobacterium alvei]